MKIGYVVKPNAKGQVVIPAELRKQLGITGNTSLNVIARDNMIQMYAVNGVVPVHQKLKTFGEILEETQGAWGEATKEEKKIEAARKKKERARTKYLRNAW